MGLVDAGRNHMVAATIGVSLTPFNNANAHLVVGNSGVATTAGMVSVQGASEARKAMDSTFPTSPPSPANRITARSTFGTADANFEWLEVALANSGTLDGGTMLSRVAGSLGTKTSSATWVLTYTLDVTAS